MHAGSNDVRAILSGTETTRRPAPSIQVLRQPDLAPAPIVQLDPRLVTLLEKATTTPESKPVDDPRVADLAARVVALEQSVREASTRLAQAAAQAETTEKLLRQLAERPNPEPPQITFSAPAQQETDGEWQIDVVRGGDNLTRRLVVTRR